MAINWFDMPASGLSNGGQFEIKELEVTENGTYEQSGEMYNKVTVNVEGGGGGSSDFSTAEVTIIWNNPEIEVIWDSCPIIENGMINGTTYADTSPAIVTVPLYKGKCFWVKATRGLTLSGNIEEYNDGEGMLITGNGTITIS